MASRSEASAALALMLASLWPAPAQAAAPVVARTRISFAVDNVNRSALRCTPDTKRYTIAGEIVGPSAGSRGARAVTATLYLHEFSFGGFFWRFGEVSGYDYAEALARRGHVSVIVDRLGYDASGHPPGSETCLGAQADVAAQLVRHLKRGTYRAARPVKFDRVFLAGHSVGGGIAELAAHSFPDLGLAGLMLFAWADQGYSARSIQQAVAQGSDCAQGGQPAERGGPAGYAYFGRTTDDFAQNVFSDTDPAVRARVSSMRNRDPCGDNSTLARMATVNAVGIGELTLPVLLLFGEKDAIFLERAAEVQAALFRSSPRVDVLEIPRAGHALPLERSKDRVHRAAAAWLAGH